MGLQADEEQSGKILAHLPDFKVKLPNSSTPCLIAPSMNSTLA